MAALPDNWLTHAVEQCRVIRRFFKKREEAAEIACIIGRIEGAGIRGKQFLSRGEFELHDAVQAGLRAADEQDNQNKQPEQAERPTGAQTCVAEICRLLGIDYNSV